MRQAHPTILRIDVRPGISLRPNPYVSSEMLNEIAVHS